MIFDVRYSTDVDSFYVSPHSHHLLGEVFKSGDTVTIDGKELDWKKFAIWLAECAENVNRVWVNGDLFWKRSLGFINEYASLRY